MRLYQRVLTLLLCVFAALPASALTSTFTADYTSGCAPLVVHFHPIDPACAGCTYTWDFGTGSPVSGYNVSSSFLTVGPHTVTLTVTSGGTTSTTSMTITVYPAPTVSFTADDTAVCPGAPVTFTNTSISGVPGTMLTTWSYGDGSPTGSGSPVVHTYPSPGYYNVALSVTNAQGCASTNTRVGYIHVYNPPIPNFTASPTSVCNPPGDVTFTSSTTGAGPFTYTWVYGDGSSAPGGSPVVHPYTTAGSYTVKLIATDANGCMDSSTRINYIYVGNVAASFTLPEQACQYSTVTFVNTSSTHTSRNWYYGDGGTSSGVNGSHAYSTPGTYTVKLVIYNGPCTDTETHTINIVAGPPGTFNISPTDPCPAPATLTYTSTGPAGTIVNWVYEGGATGTGSPASYTYSTNGIKTVSMIMTDPVTGCKDTVTKIDTIFDLIFTARAFPDRGCKPLVVNFNTTAITMQPDGLPHPYPVPFASYSWTYGDGSPTGSGSGPTHTYVDSGVYWAVVTGVTANGCTVKDSVRILVGVPPAATFTATPTHICYKSTTPITFTVSVTQAPADSFYWEFGDGTSSVLDTTVQHTYTLPGVWTVTMTPFYHGCPGTPVIKTNYITVDSPKAIIRHTFNCIPATRVTFGDSSLGDDTHLWIFGDGTTSTADNPIHDFPALAVYTVQLATYNIRSGCRDTATLILNLVKPIPNFTADNTNICKYGSATFTSTVTGGTAASYAWYSNGVLIPSLFTPTITYTFNTSGIYTIMLVIMDVNGCLDTVSRPNYMTVGKPIGSFTGLPVTGCLPLTVTFTDASTDVPGLTLTSFHWNFGDGASGITSSPVISHTYTAAGTYTVYDTVIDNIGCRDTARRPSYITVNQPTAAFTASNVHPCVNGTITFTNGTTGGAVDYLWTFGDGTTSTLTSPTHSYSATGSYGVSLTATDANGCTHTLSVPAYIVVTRPDASFYMSDSVSVCAPLTVHFFNTTTGATSYAWTFGDGNSSMVASPTDLYTVPGLFDVRLIATNLYGCKDTAMRHVNIFGYAGAFTYTPLSGCTPLSVLFTATLTNVPNIIWDFSDGTTSTASSSDTISHVYTTPGAYVPKLILSDNSGCQNSSIGADTIKVDGVNPKFVTIPNPVCLGTPFNFIDSSTTYWSPIVSWTWTYDGNTSNISSPTYTINTPGTYPVNLRVVNGWGCVGIVDKDIVVYPLPVVTASRDTVVCVSDSATLYGYGASTYAWSDPAGLGCTACNPAKASPSVLTTYTVIGTDIHGCKDTTSVTVGLRTLTIAGAWGDTAVCYGVPVQLHDTGGHVYEWFPPLGLSNPKISDPIATPPYTTIYTVVARLGSCIPDTDKVTVTVYPLPTVDAGPDQRLLAGTTAQLNATGTNIATYAWAPAWDLNCADCPSPVASMSVMTTYRVEVATIHDCRASDSMKVVIYCDNSQVFIPNAFTPNGDGENDVFYPRGIGIKIVKSFRIYNRWGELLFERNDIELNDAKNAWDGSFKGGDPHPDVYVYIIDAVCYTGDPVFIKGDVTIIR